MPVNDRSKRLKALKAAAAKGTPESRLSACRALLKDFPSRRPRETALAVLRRLAKDDNAEVAEKAQRLLHNASRPRKGQERQKRTATPKAGQTTVSRHPGEPDWSALGLPDPRTVKRDSDITDAVRQRLRATGHHDLWWFLYQGSHGGFSGLGALAKEL